MLRSAVASEATPSAASCKLAPVAATTITSVAVGDLPHFSYSRSYSFAGARRRLGEAGPPSRYAYFFSGFGMLVSELRVEVVVDLLDDRKQLGLEAVHDPLRRLVALALIGHLLLAQGGQRIAVGIGDTQAGSSPVLGDVPDHEVLRVVHRPRVGLPHGVDDQRERVRVVAEVIGDGMLRLGDRP